MRYLRLGLAAVGLATLGVMLTPPASAQRTQAEKSNMDLVGSSDLSMEMGIPGENGHPKIQEAVDKVIAACKKHGGFYLGSIGGPAAILAKENITKVEPLEYPELGMEAIWKIEVENFPAFIVIDDKGNDFFKELNLG